MCSVAATCAKVILYVLTAVVIICGLVVASSGFIFKFISGEMDANLVPPSTVTCFIVFGALMIIIGVFGCVAGFIPSKLVLRIYAGALLFMGLLLLGLGIYGLITGGRVTRDTVNTERKKLLADEKKYNHSSKAKKHIDVMHETFQCCGVDKPDEWRNLYEYPSSCCPITKVKNGPCRYKDIYKHGCKKKATDTLNMVFKVIYALVMLFAVIFMATGSLAILIAFLM